MPHPDRQDYRCAGCTARGTDCLQFPLRNARCFACAQRTVPCSHTAVSGNTGGQTYIGAYRAWRALRAAANPELFKEPPGPVRVSARWARRTDEHVPTWFVERRDALLAAAGGASLWTVASSTPTPQGCAEFPRAGPREPVVLDDEDLWKYQGPRVTAQVSVTVRSGKGRKGAAKVRHPACSMTLELLTHSGARPKRRGTK